MTNRTDRILRAAVLGIAACTTAPGNGDLESRCVDLCETQNACDAGEQVDCVPACDDYVSGSETAGCTAEFEAALTCWENLDDACVVTGCDQEEQAWLACAAAYCVTHPEEPECDGGAGGAGAQGGGGAGGQGGGGLGGSGGGGEGPNVCPYTAAPFDCVQACANLKTIAATCEDDPAVPPEVQTVLGLANMGMGAACAAACAADSQLYPDQWACFQGAPVESCTAVAGCTTVNCPGL